MSDTNITLKIKENQYHHLTIEDRITIESLINQKNCLIIILYVQYNLNLSY